MLDARSLQITPEILRFIARIDEFKGAWRALGTLPPQRLSALRRVATIESIRSSTRIEGSKLANREVERCSVSGNQHAVLLQKQIEAQLELSNFI